MVQRRVDTLLGLYHVDAIGADLLLGDDTVVVQIANIPGEIETAKFVALGFVTLPTFTDLDIQSQVLLSGITEQLIGRIDHPICAADCSASIISSLSDPSQAAVLKRTECAEIIFIKTADSLHIKLVVAYFRAEFGR